MLCLSQPFFIAFLKSVHFKGWWGGSEVVQWVCACHTKLGDVWSVLGTHVKVEGESTSTKLSLTFICVLQYYPSPNYAHLFTNNKLEKIEISPLPPVIEIVHTLIIRGCQFFSLKLLPFFYFHPWSFDSPWCFWSSLSPWFLSSSFS